MATREKAPQAEDVMSVGTRVSWAAIFAGGILALAIHFLLSLLGTAVGVSVSDRVDPDKIRTGALIWVVVTTCAALFAGGMITSLFTVGENKVEAVIYGVLMWALLMAMLIGLGAMGLRAGFSAMVNIVHVAQNTSGMDLEAALVKAGIPKAKINEFRDSLTAGAKEGAKDAEAPRTNEAPQTAEAATEAAIEATKKITWYTFGGAWISMLAAAAGAWVGAGPTFRVVRVV